MHFGQPKINVSQPESPAEAMGVAQNRWAWLKSRIAMEEVKEAMKCILIGVKDSVVGVWPVVHLLKK